MTRIIAGAARGVRLAVPGAGTRPTSDRVRESLFGALEAADAIEDARVLDLYAGTGALGLEALSRGATHAEFVERSHAAAMVTRRNAQAVAKALGAPLAAVREQSVSAFLKQAVGPFDLVFTDPPYDLDDATMAADLSAVARVLSPQGLVVVERAARSTAPDFAAAGLALARDRVYGDTAVWWAELQPTVSSQSR